MTISDKQFDYISGFSPVTLDNFQQICEKIYNFNNNNKILLTILIDKYSSKDSLYKIFNGLDININTYYYVSDIKKKLPSREQLDDLIEYSIGGRKIKRKKIRKTIRKSNSIKRKTKKNKKTKK